MGKGCTFIDYKGMATELSVSEFFERIPPQTINRIKAKGDLEIEIDYCNNGKFRMQGVDFLFQDGVAYPPAGMDYRIGYAECDIDNLSDDIKALFGI